MRNAPFLFSKQRQAANVPSTRRGDCFGRRCGVLYRKAPRTPNNRHSGCFILCFAEDSVRRRQNIPFNSQSLRDCGDFSCPPLSATKKHPACTGCFLWRREGDSNSRSGITRTHDFQSCALDQLSHLSNTTILLYYFFSRLSRAFREKNPCFSMFLGAICKNRFLPCRSVETGPHGISRQSCGQSPAREPAGRRSRKRAPPPSRKALTRPKL